MFNPIPTIKSAIPTTMIPYARSSAKLGEPAPTPQPLGLLRHGGTDAAVRLPDDRFALSSSYWLYASNYEELTARGLRSLTANLLSGNVGL